MEQVLEQGLERAIFAAGCFWGIETAFRKIEGVVDAAVGYSGGKSAHPTYEAVCSGQTGHAEVVQVDFDPNQVSYDALLSAFWEMHDPTTLNRQGPDVGTQYRSAIFYLSGEQADAARASLDTAQASGRFRGPIVTEITAATDCYRAEEYHQRYFEKQFGRAMGHH